MRAFIYPYRKGSKSVKALSQALGGKRIKLENSKYRERGHKVVINWGSSSCPYSSVNNSKNVGHASNKLTTFKMLEEAGVSVPDFTTNPLVAQTWGDNGQKVVVRHKLQGSCGDGIEIVERGEGVGCMVPSAPLYVKYIPKKDEYRVHVMAGKVIDAQRKMRNRSVADGDVNWQVRNCDNGFVFGRDMLVLPTGTTREAIEAVDALGLDFGAVDIIYNQHENKCYVLEVNTAPGLTGTTLERYKEGFQRNYL